MLLLALNFQHKQTLACRIHNKQNTIFTNLRRPASVLEFNELSMLLMLAAMLDDNTYRLLLLKRFKIRRKY